LDMLLRKIFCTYELVLLYRTLIREGRYPKDRAELIKIGKLTEKELILLDQKDKWRRFVGIKKKEMVYYFNEVARDILMRKYGK